MRKTVSGIILSLLVISTLTLAFNIQPAEASGTIYIRADGSIDPPTAPIQRDGGIYTFTDNVYEPIVVERDNIILDGIGYTIQGTGSGTGILLSGRSNVTLKNMKIKAFLRGLYLNASLNNYIFGTNVTNNENAGIYCWYSSNNIFLMNNITHNKGFGLVLFYSSNNKFRNNKLINNTYNFGVLGSGKLEFINDADISNTVDGKPIYYLINMKNLVIEPKTHPEIGYLAIINSTNIAIKSIELANNREGILFAYTNNSKIENVTAINNFIGIELQWSHNNTVSRSKMTENNAGAFIACSNSNIFSENDIINNGDTGLYFSGSSNNSIVLNNVATGRLGVYLESWSNHNSILRNNITANTDGYWGVGIGIQTSSNNIIAENNLVTNYFGFYLIGSSHDNKVYHNNIINNTNQVSIYGSYNNVWDDGYPSGGNYWSDYVGVDFFNGPYQNVTGSDGIGDTPYVIDSNNKDNYPFMGQNWWQTHPISIETNVTITSMKANRYSLNFTASGPTGQIGYVNATVPVGLNQTEIKVFIDNVELIPPPFPIITTNGTHYFIYFEFTLSTHNITMQYAIADIATTNITPAKTIVGQGYTIRINATIQNQGDYEETFNVTVYTNTTSIATQTVTLTSLNSTTITFTWNTTGFAYGNYTIWAYAWPVLGETHTEDNTLIDGWVIVTIPGDVNGDRIVDISDLVITVGTIPSTPTINPENWNPNADINSDGVCDVSDLVICVGNIPSGPW